MVVEPLMLLTRAALPATVTVKYVLLFSRLLVEELDIGAVQLALDVHVAEASPQRIPLDAHATPVRCHTAVQLLTYCRRGSCLGEDRHCCASGGGRWLTGMCAVARQLALPATAAVRLWAWPGTLVRGLGAHYLGEALLNAPQVLGSLDLVLNPTGAPAPPTTPSLPACLQAVRCTRRPRIWQSHQVAVPWPLPWLPWLRAGLLFLPVCEAGLTARSCAGAVAMPHQTWG
jgi:hypothetical protein